jgi:hypothetical protein
MATRSRIAVMHGDKIKSVYCHWDGYLSHNGAILKEFYDSSKANQLVALGNISSLRRNIGEKHAFSELDISDEDCVQFQLDHKDSCTFYGRDREDEGQEFIVAHSFNEFLSQVEDSTAEFYYVMKEGVWYVGAVYSVPGLIANGLVPLSEVIEKEFV